MLPVLAFVDVDAVALFSLALELRAYCLLDFDLFDLGYLAQKDEGCRRLLDRERRSNWLFTLVFGSAFIAT